MHKLDDWIELINECLKYEWIEVKNIRLSYLVPFLVSESGQNVDMSYLQFKWNEMFTLLDVSEDNLLDTYDIDLFADHYVRENNLTDGEVKYGRIINMSIKRLIWPLIDGGVILIKKTQKLQWKCSF